MHPDLSPHLHTPECNKLINEFKNCHEIHSVVKFFGKCNKIDKQVVDCLRRERAQNQAINRKKALERQQKIREQVKLME